MTASPNCSFPHQFHISWRVFLTWSSASWQCIQHGLYPSSAICAILLMWTVSVSEEQRVFAAQCCNLKHSEGICWLLGRPWWLRWSFSTTLWTPPLWTQTSGLHVLRLRRYRCPLAYWWNSSHSQTKTRLRTQNAFGHCSDSRYGLYLNLWNLKLPRWKVRREFNLICFQSTTLCNFVWPLTLLQSERFAEIFSCMRDRTRMLWVL